MSLDRDGVISVNRDDHVKPWEEFVSPSSVLEGLQALAVPSVLVLIVTNQSVVGHGIMTQARLNGIHARVRSSRLTAAAAVLCSAGDVLWPAGSPSLGEPTHEW